MGTPFAVRKLGHTVVFVSDIERSKKFYCDVLGFKISDEYPNALMPGGMLFLRCNPDHHCLALVGNKGSEPNGRSLHHIAFEVGSLDEVFRARDHLQQAGTKIVFQGRRRAGCQVAVEFLDPDGHHLELYWDVDQIGSDGRARSPEEWRPTASLEEAVRKAPPGQDTTLHDAALRARIEAGTDHA